MRHPLRSPPLKMHAIKTKSSPWKPSCQASAGFPAVQLFRQRSRFNSANQTANSGPIRSAVLFVRLVDQNAIPFLQRTPQTLFPQQYSHTRSIVGRAATATRGGGQARNTAAIFHHPRRRSIGALKKRALSLCVLICQLRTAPLHQRATKKSKGETVGTRTLGSV